MQQNAAMEKFSFHLEFCILYHPMTVGQYLLSLLYF